MIRFVLLWHFVLIELYTDYSGDSKNCRQVRTQWLNDSQLRFMCLTHTSGGFIYVDANINSDSIKRITSHMSSESAKRITSHIWSDFTKRKTNYISKSATRITSKPYVRWAAGSQGLIVRHLIWFLVFVLLILLNLDIT